MVSSAGVFWKADAFDFEGDWQGATDNMNQAISYLWMTAQTSPRKARQLFRDRWRIWLDTIC